MPSRGMQLIDFSKRRVFGVRNYPATALAKIECVKIPWKSVIPDTHEKSILIH